MRRPISWQRRRQPSASIPDLRTAQQSGFNFHTFRGMSKAHSFAYTLSTRSSPFVYLLSDPEFGRMVGMESSMKRGIHTVLSEPDESRLSLVWRGSAVALRPYICWMTYNACPLELSGEIFRPERIYESIL